VDRRGSTTGRRARPPRQAPTPKQRAATVKAALADPKIAREVVRDTRSAAQISRAFRAEGRQQVKAAEDRAAERNPALPTYGAAHHLNMARGRIVDAAKEVQRMNNPRDELVLRGIEQVENALGWLKTLVEGGDPDQELVALLRGR